MKQVLFSLLAAILFFSCSTDDGITNHRVRDDFATHGLKPSEIENIAYVDITEYNGVKIAIGQRNKNAWIAKFDNSGNEVFSKEYKLSSNGISQSFFHSSKSFIELPDTPHQYDKTDCNILFAYANIEERDFNSGDLHANIISNNAAFLAIDFDNGSLIMEPKITTRIDDPESDGYRRDYHYRVSPSNASYMLETYKYKSGYSNIASISQKGVLWDREATDVESKNNGIWVYFENILIDSERLFYKKGNNYAILNLKDVKIEKEFSDDELQHVGDNEGRNYSFGNFKRYLKEYTIYYEYDEIETIVNVDEITGKEEVISKTLNTFYYEIDTKTLEVSERKKK